MRLIFIRPPADGLIDGAGSRYNRAWPPLDLLNCSAIAREAGAKAIVLDLMAKRHCLDEIKKSVAGSDCIFITTAALDRWQCPVLDLDNYFSFIRDLGSKNMYIMGTHGSIYPEWVLEQTNAAGIIRNEPEGFVKALCRKIPINDLPGLSRREGGKIIHNPDALPLDLSSLPIPDYDLIDLDHYSYPLLGDRIALLETTRGCSFSCTFCLKTMYGKGVREKSLDQVTEEIDYILTTHKPGSIYFIDLEFTLKRKMALHVCNVLRRQKKKITWACQTRADLVDSELLEEMASSGCNLIHYGIESGSQKILDIARKKMDLDIIETAIRSTKQAGIETACFFLFGFPGETRQDMEDTIHFAQKLNPDYASFHIVTPYPGTPLAEFAISDKKFERYCKTGLSPENLEKLVRRAYMAYYIRPQYVVNALLKGKPSLWLKQLKLFKEFIGL